MKTLRDRKALRLTRFPSLEVVKLDFCGCPDFRLSPSVCGEPVSSSEGETPGDETDLEPDGLGTNCTLTLGI